MQYEQLTIERVRDELIEALAETLLDLAPFAKAAWLSDALNSFRDVKYGSGKQEMECR